MVTAVLCEKIQKDSSTIKDAMGQRDFRFGQISDGLSLLLQIRSWFFEIPYNGDESDISTL